ncbi:hypothetical protein H5P36_04840 [Bacillus sp. APMAM]|nr:hypothetical protein [Bacillus sp. APMAM]
MKEIVYDNHFNENEWFVIISFCIGAMLVYCLPRRFPKKITYVFLMCGVFFGIFFAHTLSVVPVSYYDIGDTSHLELFDLLSQFNYGPYSYLFFYFYDRFRINPKFSPIYILFWSFFSIGSERLSDAFGVYHYTNGYNIFYSFAIYLCVFSFWVPFYYVIMAYSEKSFGKGYDDSSTVNTHKKSRDSD